MDKQRLVIGLGGVLLVVGALLVCFTPGGLFNSGGRASLDTPLVSFSVSAEKKSSAGPIIGYVLLGVGGVSLVAGFAMKSPPKS